MDLAQLITQLWHFVALSGGVAPPTTLILAYPDGADGGGFPWGAVITGAVTALAAIGAATIAVRQFALGRFYDRVDQLRQRTSDAVADVLRVAIEASERLRVARWETVDYIPDDSDWYGEKSTGPDDPAFVFRPTPGNLDLPLRQAQKRLLLFLPESKPVQVALGALLDAWEQTNVELTWEQEQGAGPPEYDETVQEQAAEVDEKLGVFEAECQAWAQTIGTQPSFRARWRVNRLSCERSGDRRPAATSIPVIPAAVSACSLVMTPSSTARSRPAPSSRTTSV